MSHGFDRVERIDGGYVLVCDCGWRSPLGESAAAVGDAWDHHLQHAA